VSNVELFDRTGTIKNLSVGRQAYLYEFFVQGEDRREEKLQTSNKLSKQEVQQKQSQYSTNN